MDTDASTSASTEADESCFSACKSCFSAFCLWLHAVLDVAYKVWLLILPFYPRRACSSLRSCHRWHPRHRCLTDCHCISRKESVTQSMCCAWRSSSNKRKQRRRSRKGGAFGACKEHSSTNILGSSCMSRANSPSSSSAASNQHCFGEIAVCGKCDIRLGMLEVQCVNVDDSEFVWPSPSHACPRKLQENMAVDTDASTSASTEADKSCFCAFCLCVHGRVLDVAYKVWLLILPLLPYTRMQLLKRMLPLTRLSLIFDRLPRH